MRARSAVGPSRESLSVPPLPSPFLMPLPSGSHFHMCTHAHADGSPDSCTSGFSYALTHRKLWEVCPILNLIKGPGVWQDIVYLSCSFFQPISAALFRFPVFPAAAATALFSVISTLPFPTLLLHCPGQKPNKAWEVGDTLSSSLCHYFQLSAAANGRLGHPEEKIPLPPA